MAVNAPRFRVYRGRVMDMDSANVLNIGTKIAAASTTVVSSQIHGFPVAGAEQGLTLQNISIKNDGNANDFFVGGLIKNADATGSVNTNWQVGLWSDGEATKYIADGDGDGAVTFAAPLSEADDGFVFASKRQFNALVFQCSTAKTVAQNWVEVVTYWDGDSWADLKTYSIATPTVSGASTTSHLFGTTAEQLYLFSPPQDWAKVTSTTRPSGVTNSALDGFYPLRWQATTVGADDPVLASVKFGNLRSAYMGMGKTSALVGETQHTPLCSSDEAPWFVMGSVHGGGGVTVFMTVEKNNFTGTIGE